ncbi:MAG: hypothetical protein H8D47_03965 [Planctomycetes bacterium]|nr:hypothetical protein [Planctomycetota bacterium]
MKKVLFLMALLAMAVPAMAGVTVSVTDNADGTATIGYDSTDANVATFGIDVTVDAGVIVSVTPAKKGFSDGSGLGYGIFPGSFRDNIDAGNPNWANVNYTPLGAAGDPGVLAGLGTDEVTLEFATIYEAGFQPLKTGVLCTVEVSANCNMTVTANGSSAGIVLVGGGAATIDALATGVPITGASVPPCFTGTAGEVAAWDAWGNPASWCNAGWRTGDVNGDTYTTFGDVIYVFDDFKAGDTTGRSDVNMDGYLTFGDVIAVFDLFKGI